MAVIAEVRTFWGALLSALFSALLKCIAALGFARAQSPVADRLNADTATATPGTAAAVGRTTTGHGLPGPWGQAVPRIPAPRGCEPVRGERDRTLPPTMKQRIRAEAHGSSPSARSIRADDLEDITAELALVGAAAGMSGSESGSRPGNGCAHNATGKGSANTAGFRYP